MAVKSWALRNREKERVMTKKELKKARKKVEQLYYKHCDRVQVPIMELSKIFAVGVQAVEEGGDDETVGLVIQAYVETIRCN
jgi:hypothetical protein